MRRVDACVLHLRHTCDRCDIALKPVLQNPFQLQVICCGCFIECAGRLARRSQLLARDMWGIQPKSIADFSKPEQEGSER